MTVTVVVTIAAIMMMMLVFLMFFIVFFMFFGSWGVRIPTLPVFALSVISTTSKMSYLKMLMRNNNIFVFNLMKMTKKCKIRNTCGDVRDRDHENGDWDSGGDAGRCTRDRSKNYIN